MPLITTTGGGSVRGLGRGRGGPTVVFTSRAVLTTEGEISNFESVPVTSGATWVYQSINTDAITITTSGSTAGLLGFSINNRASGSNPHVGILYVISGNSTSGTILGQKSFSVLLPLNDFQTIIEFDAPVILPPGTYTCAMAWPEPIIGTSTRRLDTTTRNTSTVTAQGKTLNVFYATTTAFNGAAPLSASNGTSHGATGAGQIVTFKWLLQ